MSRQYTFDDLPPLNRTDSAEQIREVQADGRTIDESFVAFHGANPHVYRKLVELARELSAKGHKRLGIGMLWEVLRYSYMRTSSDPFKLNNNYRSRYVRLIIEREPDLGGLFECRRLRSD